MPDTTIAAAPATADATGAPDRLRRDQSVAKSLFVGEILEENLFPYPQIRARDREILGSVVEAIDGFLDGKEGDFKIAPNKYVRTWRTMGVMEQPDVDHVRHDGGDPTTELEPPPTGA